MDHSTEIRNPSLPQSPDNALRGGRGMIWEKIKLGIKRTVFWAFERGTWQYDLMVLAILAFIFLSPRSWFDDRPTLGLTDLRHQRRLSRSGTENKAGAT